MQGDAPTHVVDALVRDAAEDQRSRGMLPRVNEVRAYVQGIVERMDAKARDRKPALCADPYAQRSRQRLAETALQDGGDALEREYRKRTARFGLEAAPGSWRVEHRGPETPKPRTVMSEVERRMRKRLRLLRSKPDWAAKLRRINPLALAGTLGEEKRLEADAEVRKVIVASDATFGPWWKEPERRLIFT